MENKFKLPPTKTLVDQTPLRSIIFNPEFQGRDGMENNDYWYFLLFQCEGSLGT